MGNPWTAFYWKDYCADTGSLTFEQHGAYLMAMAHCYMTGEPLPANTRALYRCCKAVARKEQKACQFVVKKFFVFRNGAYHHDRITEELKKTAGLREIRSNAAKKRFSSQLEPALANANAQQMPSISSANAPDLHTQSQSQSQPHTHKSKAKSLARFASSDIYQIYKSYPKRKQPADAQKAIEKSIEVLIKNPESPVENRSEAIVFLLQRARLYAKAREGQDEQFTPYPASWFNAGSYLEDEIDWRKRGTSGQAVTKTQQRVSNTRQALADGFGLDRDAGHGEPNLRARAAAGGVESMARTIEGTVAPEDPTGVR